MTKRFAIRISTIRHAVHKSSSIPSWMKEITQYRACFSWSHKSIDTNRCHVYCTTQCLIHQTDSKKSKHVTQSVPLLIITVYKRRDEWAASHVAYVKLVLSPRPLRYTTWVNNHIAHLIRCSNKKYEMYIVMSPNVSWIIAIVNTWKLLKWKMIESVCVHSPRHKGLQSPCPSCCWGSRFRQQIPNGAASYSQISPLNTELEGFLSPAKYSVGVIALEEEWRLLTNQRLSRADTVRRWDYLNCCGAYTTQQSFVSSFIFLL